MKLWKVAAIVGGGALCVVTGGLAAPAIGAAVGGVMGLSGAAATSAGLAALGGGSLAAGGMGMAGGTAVVSAVAGGVGVVGTAVGTTIGEGKKAQSDLKKVKNVLYETQKSEKSKQAVIIKLQKQIDELNVVLNQKIKEGNASAQDISEFKEKIQILVQEVQRLKTEDVNL